jgi:crossover junction endodeoxyribonuclease RuvC
MKIISVDPGTSGAICIKDENTTEIYDLPIFKDHNNKKQIDIPKLVQLVKKHKDADYFVIEAVFAMIGNGISSMFNFGRTKGIIEGIAHSFEIKVHMVTPQTWKKHFTGLIQYKEKGVKLTPKEKSESKKKSKVLARELASKYSPELSHQFKNVNSDGRAEALLINIYTRENIALIEKSAKEKGLEE